MQLFGIAIGIRAIGFVTACLLLCSAQSFEPAPRLYRAKPDDVPPWAEQGNFRFIRIDGGQFERWKAERTWWGKKFSAEEKDVLTHIYDRDFEQMLDLLKQADFNWIWVTWSSGWSLKDENANRENLKRVIAHCHENGIHVSAYLSASNMFRTSAFRDDPETKKYGLWMHRIPMFYAGPTKADLQISWDRRLADARKPGWRAYLLKKAELAVDAGVDAIVWDNMIGYNDGLAQTSILRFQRIRPGQTSISFQVGSSVQSYGVGDRLQLCNPGLSGLSCSMIPSEWRSARVVHLPFTVPHPRSVLAVLFPDHLVHVVHRKPVLRNMDIRFNYDLGPAGVACLPPTVLGECSKLA
jgi:hypothetical protein